MNQGDRCLVIHGGVEMEGVIKSHHRELDQVLVAVHKECGGYFEILRSPQDLRLVSESSSSSMKWKDNLETAEERPTTETSSVTPMDLDSEERDTAVFLANLSTSGTNVIDPTPSRSWTDKDGESLASHRSISRSAPASGFVMGRFPKEEMTGVQVSAKCFQKEKFQVPGPFNSHSPSQSPSVHTHLQELRAESGDDVDSIARIMEISLNASSPTGAQNYRPIVYLATSPQFEESDAPGVLLTTRASSSLTAHTVSRPINIPVRRQGREIPISGLSSPKHSHVAHLVLSDSTMAASLSSSTSSTSAFGSVPTQLGSLSPPSSLPPGATSVPIPGSGRRVRSDVKKCRKIYGIEHRDQWCNQCRWKKACTRFPDPTSPPRHG